MRKLTILAILKGGAQKVLPCLEGGRGKSFGPMMFPLCSLPLPGRIDMTTNVVKSLDLLTFS